MQTYTHTHNIHSIIANSICCEILIDYILSLGLWCTKLKLGYKMHCIPRFLWLWKTDSSVLYPNDDVGDSYTETLIDERALERYTVCHMISFYVFLWDQFIMWQISTEQQHHDKGSGFVSAIPEVLQSNAKHD